MKTRIISALVGTVILLGVLFCPYEWVFVFAAAALAAIAVWELLHNTGKVNSALFTVGSMVFAAAEVIVLYHAQELTSHRYMESPMLALWMSASRLLPLVLPLIYSLFAMLTMLARHERLTVSDGCFGIFMTVYATLGFGSLAALRAESGLVAMLLTLIIPWMSDTGAYFTGVLFGKHKMAPIISPKKSWEGFFGGWVFSVACAALFGVICNAIYNAQGLHFDPLEFALFAAVLAPLSVCGDLFASVIKRQCGIKDYGNLMPGHGGVMDRFDSVVFIAPLMYAAVLIDSLL